MMNLLPVLSRLLLLMLAIAALIFYFVPRIKIPGGEITIYAGTGIYLVLMLIEMLANIGDARTVKDTTRLSFNYLTKSIVFRRIIMFVILLAIAVITFVTINIMSIRVLAIAAAAMEFIMFAARFSTGYYRVVIDRETLSIIEDQRKIAHHSRIKDVEFRYEVFFFRMKDNNVYEVDLFSIKKDQQKQFVQAILKWLAEHNIPITQDGTQKLQAFL